MPFSERRIYLVIMDILIATATVATLFYIHKNAIYNQSFYIMYIVVWLATLHLFNGYDLKTVDDRFQSMVVLAESTIAATIVVVSIHDPFGISLSSPELAAHGIVTGNFLAVHRYLYSKLLGRSPEVLRVAILNPFGDGAWEYLSEILSESKGLVEFHGKEPLDEQNPNEFIKRIVDGRINVILVEKDVPHKQEEITALEKLEEQGVTIINIEDFYEETCKRIPLSLINGRWDYNWSSWFSEKLRYHKFKSLMNWIIGLPALLLSIPIVLAAAIAIFMEDGRPVFYVQERIGKKGKNFKIFKLRSMKKGAEESNSAVWAAANDLRISKVGRVLRKWRLDELPQFINVLKGDMNIVGPRPERPEFVRELTESIPFYTRRHVVKPGITGWSQVRFPYGASVRESLQKLTYDLWYIKNRNIMLDFLILVETVFVVLGRRGSR